MPFIKDGQIVADQFVRVADDQPVPDATPVLLSAGRLLGEADQLVIRTAPLGVIWPNNRNLVELLPYLQRLAVIGLVFPTFRDGRAYTQARLLRERYGFRNELRATGQVLRDQFLFLVRAGFDAFEVAKPADAVAFTEVMRRFSVFYQPTGDGRLTVRRARQATAVSFQRAAPRVQDLSA